MDRAGNLAATGPGGAGAGVDALVLAGGSARRLGGADKMALRIGADSLLERVLAATTGARRVVVVGPPRPGVPATVVWCREDPPGGGPVAALAAGLRHARAGTVLVLAGDLPWIGPAVPALLAALAADPTAAAAELVDPSGRRNHLAAAWRRPALVGAVAALGDPTGAPVRRLGHGVRIADVPDTGGWGRDCDTWDDVAAARTRDARHEPGRG